MKFDVYRVRPSIQMIDAKSPLNELEEVASNHNIDYAHVLINSLSIEAKEIDAFFELGRFTDGAASEIYESHLWGVLGQHKDQWLATAISRQAPSVISNLRGFLFLYEDYLKRCYPYVYVALQA